MITKFSQFKEEYKPINEGGGAGIQFEMKFENQNAMLTIHNGKIEYDSAIVNTDEFTITGEGYDDGGTFTGQLEVSDQIPTNMNKIIEMLKHVTISDLIYSCGEDEVFKSFQLAKDMNTHTSIYDYSFKDSVDIYVELDFLYKEMKFGGWMRGNLEAGETMFTGEDIDTNEYCRIYFNDCEFVSSVKEKPQNQIAFEDLYSLFVPNIIISEELASWYDSVFINPETDEDWDEEFESKINENYDYETFRDYLEQFETEQLIDLAHDYLIDSPELEFINDYDRDEIINIIALELVENPNTFEEIKSIYLESAGTAIKGLNAFVYKNAATGDATANGVSSRFDSFILVDENLVGNGPFESKDPNHDDVLVIVHDTIMNKPRVRAIPYNIYINKQHSMFGGNFVYTSDSRMPTGAPIKIFDRVEG